ncbi:hypothetical protein POM88_044982 [Heracleum sosnowskyi]|uniref:Uncharacterized protein n=1 Tax=Heracleum sosnowskyi TaxID=360622 RepID=A0AAD8H688_9APIA|nr:hypothetical protein POM88_044982 [Heracleum sosnowskyi]
MQPWFGLSVIDIAQLPHGVLENIARVRGDNTTVVKEISVRGYDSDICKVVHAEILRVNDKKFFLENWYYRILIVMTGNLKNAKIAVDALSICMSINGWELMIALAFFAATGVSNELGACNGKGAKFATIVAVLTSTLIGLLFWLLIMIFHNELALIFTSSKQPILSGVAVGFGWQSYVAYINLGCYYLIGLPLGIAMGWIFNQGVMGIWAGMIFGGTFIQTLILALITIRCDWEKEVRHAAINSSHVIFSQVSLA